MTTSTNQFRVTYQDETINGKREFGTIWYDVNFFDAKNIIAKYSNKEGFEIVTRTIIKDSKSFQDARRAKFNN